MELGRIGVWAGLDGLGVKEATAFAQRIESQGYGALWIPEAVGRDPFATIGYLAAQTSQLVFATGIANIYARDAMATNAIRKTLAEFTEARFVLGLGVSHKHLVSNQRGHDYEKPLTTMRNYLEAMDKALYMGKEPEHAAPVVIGALRDKMLALSASAANGAHPYNVTPDHTRHARSVLGPDALLCPEQMVLAVTDAAKAREIGRKHLGVYIRLPNYQNNWRQQGFGDADFENGGSDALVDAMVAWGDDDAIEARVREHLDAGATHVCLQAFPTDGSFGIDEGLLERLAGRLL